MKNAIKIALLTTAFILSFLTAFSQPEVLISEYFNASANPNGEWTELIITRNASLVGYKLRDNASEGTINNWQGGVIFKNHELWRNLRPGTIIVIHHRLVANANRDADKKDGYIEVAAFDTEYLERYCDNCDMADWDDPAGGRPLNISQTHDLLQVLNPSGQSIHTLGNGIQSIGESEAFKQVTGPKMMFRGGLGGGASIKVVPGANAGDYTRGYDANGDWLSNQSVVETQARGLPNTTTRHPRENSDFWRRLREPSDWSRRDIRFAESGNNINISWDGTSEVREDFEGYMLVQYRADFLSANPDDDIPKDGRIYDVNANVGRGRVLFVSSGNVTNHTISKDDLVCGVKYNYRVFAYRYNRDMQGKDNIESNARGRAYNQIQFAEYKDYALPSPPAPTISGRNEFCRGTNTTLTAETDEDGATFQWYIIQRDNPINGATQKTLTVTNPGVYYVRIVSQGCELYSEPFEVKIIEFPRPEVYISGKRIMADTTVYLCANEDRNFEIRAAEKFRWEKDGQNFADTSHIKVAEVGVYKPIGINGLDCERGSFTITVVEKEINLVSIPTALSFGPTEFFTDRNFILKNNSNTAIELTNANIFLTADFSLISPALPIVIQPVEEQEMTVRFAPSRSGNVNSEIIISLDCGSELVIPIDGSKPDTDISSDRTLINFPRVLSCDIEQTLIQKVVLTSDGVDDIILLEPIIDAPFSIISPAFNYTLVGLSDIEIDIHFQTNADGVYQTELKIPFSDDGINARDTLRILLNAEYREINASISTELVDFGILSACEDYFESSVVITNESNIPLDFENVAPADPRLTFLNYPTLALEAGESYELRFEYRPFEIIENFTFNLNLEPCELNFEINIKSILEGLIFNTPAEMDFGDIVFCDGITQHQSTSKLTVSGSGDDEARISEIITPPNFALNLQVGEILKLSDEIALTFTFKPENAGYFEEDLIIRFEPCGEKIIKLKGRRIDVNYTTTDMEIDFDLVPINGRGSSLYLIQNLSTVPIFLNSIDGVTEPFSFNIQQAGAYPYRIEPNANLRILFEYRPQEVGRDDKIEAILRLSADNCIYETVLPLSGKSPEPPKRLVRARIPGGQRINITDRISLPVYIEKIDSDAFSSTGISKVQINVSYSTSILYPENAILGLDIPPAAIANFAFQENYPLGRIEITFDVVDASLLDDGVWVRINFSALVGDVLSTPIRINSDIFTSEVPIEVERVFGDIEVFGICNAQDRFISIGEGANVAINDGVVISNSINLDYNVVGDGNLHIGVYNSAGVILNNLVDRYVKSGKYNVLWNNENLSNGVYFIYYRTEFEQRFYKLLLMR